MKRIVALLLAVLLVGGMAGTAFADTSGTYTIGFSGTSGAQLSSDSAGVVHPGETLEYDVFVDGAPATRTRIKTDKIDVKVKLSEGSKGLDSATIKYNSSGYAYIQLEFIDPYVSTSDLDFSYTIYLTKNKTRMEETEVEVVGTFENYEQTVGANDDYINLAHSPVVEADAYIRDIEVELGDGLSLFTKMFEGKRYYGYVHQDITSADEQIIDRYPAIDTIYYLKTINLNAANNYAVFDIDDKMFVYNADLQYIGTTSDKLPYSTKYYLSTLELDVDEDSLYDTIPSTSDAENIASGGDTTPENVNRNPGTGA